MSRPLRMWCGVWVLLTLCTALAMQAQGGGYPITAEQAFHFSQQWIAEDSAILTTPFYPLCVNLHILAEEETSIPDSILEFQLQIAVNPANHEQLRLAAMEGLAAHGSDSVVVAETQNMLTDTSVRSAAAGLLAGWGFGSEVSQVLMDEENYLPLVVNQVPGYLTLLETARTTASPHGRMQAAQLLEDKDPGILAQTSEEVLDEFVIEDSTWADDHNLGRAAYLAFKVLEQSENVIESFAEPGANSSNASVRRWAMATLSTWGKQRNETARTVLTGLVSNSGYLEIRAEAEYYLNIYWGSNYTGWRIP